MWIIQRRHHHRRVGQSQPFLARKVEVRDRWVAEEDELSK
jgi:hypothetical protein